MSWRTCQTCNDFVAGFTILLSERGVATFEFPHVLEMIRNVEFDTIYHEHYSYLSLLALEPLFKRHGLQVVDVERLSTHGGSLRLYVAPADHMTVDDNVGQLRQLEIAARLDQVATYEAFGQRVRHLKRSLLRLLIELVENGKSVAAYGAPAKGNTLLNYCGIVAGLYRIYGRPQRAQTQGHLLPGTQNPRSWHPRKSRSEDLTTSSFYLGTCGTKSWRRSISFPTGQDALSFRFCMLSL